MKTTVRETNEWGTGVVMILGVILEAILAFMYTVGDLFEPMMPVAIVAALVFVVCLIVNLIQHNGKSVLVCLISGSVMCLVFFFTLYSIRGVDAVKEQVAKNKVVSEVVKEGSGYTKEFQMNGSDYYSNPSFTTLYRIKKTGLLADYETYEMHSADQLKGLGWDYSSFYSLSENATAFMAYDPVAYAFFIDQQSTDVLVRIKNVEDNLLYARIGIDDPAGFINGMNLTSGAYTFDGASVYYLKAAEPFDAVEGIDLDKTLPAEGSYTVYYTQDGVSSELTIGRGTVPFIITVSDKGMYVSQVFAITFDDQYPFTTRVPAYEDDFVHQQIDALEKQISDKSISATQKTELRTKLKQLKEEQINYGVEIVSERRNDFGTLRLYRVVYDSSYCAAIPPMSVAEIKLADGTYRYGRTNLNSEDLFITMPLNGGDAN